MRRAVMWTLLAIAAAGCGAPDEAAPPPPVVLGGGTPEAGGVASEPEPTKAARQARPEGRVAARLAAGETALVDLTGRIGIRPRELSFAKGGRMEAVAWSRWTDRSAVGTGRMVGIVCDPTCAHGTTITVPATITLSRPVACPEGRFFDQAKIEAASDDPDAESGSWLAAPC